MRSIVTALAWEIWWRNRRMAWLAVWLVPLGWLANQIVPARFLLTEEHRAVVVTLDSFLLVFSLLFIYWICNFTDFNPEREWTGFPYRLFTLPAPTWLLVATPMLFGMGCVEAVFWLGARLVFYRVEMDRLGWFGALAGAYLVIYQCILWSLAGFPIMRTMVLGLTGTSLVGVACLPFLFKYVGSPWLDERRLLEILLGLVIAAYLIAWKSVDRQRHSGGQRRKWVRELVERVADVLPRRRREFDSVTTAQIWFEWRRRGIFLPACVGCLIALVIAPLSWILRAEADATLWILAWTLVTPVILALPMGANFLQPDFWSRAHSMPPFLAIKPLTTGGMTVIKLKLAAVTTGVTWLLVLLFLAVWLPLWANLAALNMVRLGFWMIYDHSVYPQYAIAGLLILAEMFLTWRFLAGGLWLANLGEKRGFIRAIIVPGLVAAAIVSSPFILIAKEVAIRGWIMSDPDRALAWVEWTAVVAIAVKSWRAVFWWRMVSPVRVRRYLLAWAVGTACMVALAVLLWGHGTFALLMESWGFPPVDPARLLRLFLLVALLVVPLTRPGLARAFLAGRRHE